MSRELGNPEHPLVDKLIEMDMTVHELADKVDVGVNTIYHWISRRRRPDHANAIKLMDVTGLTYDQLIRPSDEEISYAEEAGKTPATAPEAKNRRHPPWTKRKGFPK